MANKNLNKAKEAKKDEFYTQLEDINNEVRHYREHFRIKTVLCNCDDPWQSINSILTPTNYGRTICKLLLGYRTFDKKQKCEAYERQKGICVHCGKHFELEEMEADHIKQWKDGGTTAAENCQMLCRDCNRVKGGK